MGEPKLSTTEVGDMTSTASQLVSAGARTKDGPVIKRGVEIYKLFYPIQMVIAIVRYLVKEAKK